MTADPIQDMAMALGRTPSGLFILTAAHDGDETGMLASWVQQCSMTPLCVSVAVRPDRPISGWLTPGSTFVLNQLGEGQTNLLSHFGKGFAPGQPAFEGLDTRKTEGGGVVLSIAMGHVVCRTLSRVNAGDHDLVVGEVVGGALHHAEAKPMVHIRKSATRY